jgi:hypothetical protein
MVQTRGSKPDLDKTYAALKRLLVPHRGHSRVEVDRPGYYSLVSKKAIFKGKPMWFAGVRKGKNYVSYYLMGLYTCPEVGRIQLSPELKKRRQGKSCSNFTRPEPSQLRELSALTRAAAAAYNKWKSS